MAMKGISLDGATKLKAALDEYYSAYTQGGLGWNSSAMYGKDTPMAKLMDELIRYVYGTAENGRKLIRGYQSELDQIIAQYQGFDNSGTTTIGKISKS